MLVWLLWKFRQRRRHLVTGPVPRPVPPPAYLDTAKALWQLHMEELPAKGEGRAFLDRLATQLRHYLVGRFGIGAAEMTPQEINTALVARGYSPRIGRAFGGLLAACDRPRYAPQQVAPALCHDLFVQAIELVGQVRVEARFTPVPAKLALVGQKSWSHLVRWLRALPSRTKRIVGEGARD